MLGMAKWDLGQQEGWDAVSSSWAGQGPVLHRHKSFIIHSFHKYLLNLTCVLGNGIQEKKITEKKKICLHGAYILMGKTDKNKYI